MSKLATFAVALGALVLAFVTLSPSSAEAGGRGRGWYGGPGVNVGPRYRYWGGPYAYGYPYAYYPYWRQPWRRGWN